MCLNSSDKLILGEFDQQRPPDGLFIISLDSICASWDAPNLTNQYFHFQLNTETKSQTIRAHGTGNLHIWKGSINAGHKRTNSFIWFEEVIPGLNTFHKRILSHFVMFRDKSFLHSKVCEWNSEL